MDFGEYVRESRIRKNMSGRELARRAGISQAYLSQLERGENKKPSLEIIVKLAEGLNEDPKNLMYITGYLFDMDFSEDKEEKIKKEISERNKQNLNNLFNLLGSDRQVYYKDKLLTKEEKQKLLTIIETVLG